MFFITVLKIGIIKSRITPENKYHDYQSIIKCALKQFLKFESKIGFIFPIYGKNRPQLQSIPTQNKIYGCPG